MAEQDGTAPKKGRREFLDHALTAMVGCVGIASVYPAYHFLVPSEPPDIMSVAVGRVDDFEPGTWRAALLGDMPVLVIRTPDNVFRAFEAMCTHLNCVVRYVGADNRIECACHGGKYNAEGVPIAGPPPRALKELPVDTSTGTVVVHRA